MTDDRQNRRERDPRADHAGTDAAEARGPSGLHDALARGALTKLRVVAPRAAGLPDPDVLGSLLAALSDEDRGRLGTAIDAMTAAGLTPEDIVDVYLPAAARRLGEAWVGDEMSFAAVTVGTARLQALLRDLSEGSGPPERGGGDGGTALLVLREGDDHSLGAMIAAAQLRRAAVSVRLSVGCPDDEVLDIVRGGGFDMIALSAGAAQDTEVLGGFVALVRAAAGRPVGIAVGGSIVSTESCAAEQGLERIRAACGADHVGTDIVRAAAACGVFGPARRAAAAGARPPPAGPA